MSEPIKCSVCKGAGEVELRSVRCHHNGCCPCATTTADCDHCDGSGYEPCSDCGDFPATELLGGEYLCEFCAADARGAAA